MPSVASDPPNVMPPRQPMPSTRNLPDADLRPPATPFSDLLDSTSAAPEPPPAPQARSDRQDQTNPADSPRPADDRATDSTNAKDKSNTADKNAAKDKSDAADAATAKDKSNAADKNAANDKSSSADAAAAKDKSNAADQDAADSKAADAGVDAKISQEFGQAAKDIQAGPTGKKTMKGDAKASAEAATKSKPDVNPTATPQVTADDTDTPAAAAAAAPLAVIAAPLPVFTAAADAIAKADTPQAGALAALQAAAGQPAAPIGAKPSQGQGDKPADPAAKGAANADPQAAKPQAPAPQVDAGKDGQAHDNGDKASGDIHSAAVEPLAKLDTAAPAQSSGDAGTVRAGADAAQNLAAVTPANASANAAAATAPNPPAQLQVAAVPLAGLAVEIVTQAHAGKSHFEIRLDPPELGRIDVKLNVDRDGNISTHVIADRSDTLDLLKRDAASLERALQQSGLKTADHGLEFSLRQQSHTPDDPAAHAGTRLIVPDDDPAPLEAMRQGYGRLLGLGGGLDIRV